MKEGLRNMTGWNSNKEQSIINEVKEYLNFLEDDVILRILERIGLDKKEINKLL